MRFRNLSFLGYKKYKISRTGVIKRLKSNGRWKRLNPWLSKDGYLSVAFSKKGKVRKFQVHRLLLLTFVGPPPSKRKTHCRHLNGIRTDNRLKNLKWGTPKRNQKDRIRHGTDNRGERHGQSKLTTEIVIKIRKYFSKERKMGSKARMARKYKVSITGIRDIINRKTWNWL